MSLDIELVWPGKHRRTEPAAVSLRVRERHHAVPDVSPNLLIHGDNLPVMAALLQQFAACIDLVYIDPPFATESVFTSPAEEGAEKIAYQDVWGQDPGTYLDFIYPRLRFLSRLLKASGSLYVHLDYRMAHPVKLLLDEIFGVKQLRNEIIWHYQSGGRARNRFSFKHDTLLLYGVSDQTYFCREAVGVPRGNTRRNHMKRGQDADGRLFWSITSAGKLYKYYDDEKRTPDDVWNDISHLHQKDPERTGYPTQKPLRLLERIIQGSCPPGGLVADFFCGSGTTLAAAEQMGRRWLGCDSGASAVATSRRRLVALPGCRPFNVVEAGAKSSRGA
jgi:site-specific DNA-methyltransferase (adenine-specific)/adenine-specific DNA-methyltransferase